MSFKGKVVLVTGGSAGIGAATAELFAKEGATIAIVGRNEDRLKTVARRCENIGATALPIKADIAKDDEARKAIEETIAAFGKLDVLVNNAGILREASILAENFLDAYDETIATNMRAVVRLTYFAVPHIIKSKGNIVNVSSVAATVVSLPNYSAYRSSKASLNHFTRCVALELAPYGVRINTVSPGPVRTDIFGSTNIDMAGLKDFTLLKRMSEAEEIAELIVYLASDKAKSVTGSDYLIDNGSALK